MDYFPGERIRILGKPEWGPGIIQKTKNGKVQVRFYEAGKKTLDLRHAKIIKVVRRDAAWLEERMRQFSSLYIH